MIFRVRTAVAALAATAVLVSGCSQFRHGVPAGGSNADSSSAPASVSPAPTSSSSTPTTVLRANAHVVVNHCAHNRAKQLVLVSIEAQHEWLCAHHRTVLSTPITSGASAKPGDATPRGTFRIQGLNRNSVLYPSGGGAYPVKYWIPFQAPLYGFHDASWQHMPFGSRHYVTHGSHGCVHMPLRAIRFLYRWAHIGTKVRIH